METSAKDATNVEQAFMAMSASIKERYLSYFIYISNWQLMLIRFIRPDGTFAKPSSHICKCIYRSQQVITACLLSKK